MPTPPPHAAPAAPVGARRPVAMRRLIGVLLAVVAGLGLGLSLPAAAHAGPVLVGPAALEAAATPGPAGAPGADAAPVGPGTSAVDLPSPGLPFAHGQGRTTLDALGARVTQLHPVDAAHAAAHPAAAVLVRALHAQHAPASAPRDGGHAPSPARAPPAA